MPIFIFVLILFPFTTFADESSTAVHLDNIPVSASASFESLSDDTFLPVTKVPLNQDHGSLLDQISKQEVFPIRNQGYPSGASAVNLGGRSNEDTQVFTLGVPLNLPQGGGPDLSAFPDFMWSEADFSPGLSSAGFSPQAASGSLQLKPWTRELVRNPQADRASFPVNRVTTSYDRQVQSFSTGTKTENVAVLAGATTGLIEGPAGELSAYLLHTAHNHLLFHALATSQKGDSPGSISSPSPNAKKNIWRVIPVLESHQELDNNVIIESTAYADFQSLVFLDPGIPGAANNSTNADDERIQQYGIENAILYGSYTLALSARYTQFIENSDGSFAGATNPHVSANVHETPLFAALTRDFSLTDRLNFKAGVNGTYVNDTGVAAGGKVSAKYDLDEHRNFFTELNTVPKMPSLVSRYYIFGNFYHGNPNLKPERVFSYLVGYDAHYRDFEATTTVKLEHRNSIQVDQGTTTVNAGNANLVYAKQDFSWNWNDKFKVTSSTLFSYSRLVDSHLPYPDLPYASQQLILGYAPIEKLEFNTVGKYMGPSTASDGRFHPDYVLIDVGASSQITRELRLSAGLENVFDNRAQLILDYPLPGRLIYASLQATF